MKPRRQDIQPPLQRRLGYVWRFPPAQPPPVVPSLEILMALRGPHMRMKMVYFHNNDRGCDRSAAYILLSAFEKGKLTGAPKTL